jgi:hypothetical protein
MNMAMIVLTPIWGVVYITILFFIAGLYVAWQYCKLMVSEESVWRQ